MATVVQDKARPGGTHGGGPPDTPGGDGDPGGGAPGFLGDVSLFGLWAFLGTVSMMFIGFTSAYMIRRASYDWRPLAPPAILWWNTAALVASSLTLEAARKRLRDWDLRALFPWMAATGVLGILFLGGQLLAWRQLTAQGVFLASSPHNSFFYVLTGVHGVHLLGGLAWFAVVLAQVRRLRLTPGEDGLRLFATYWHFLAALWVYLLFLLFVL
jgi:cytochrome c oxidase subunit III